MVTGLLPESHSQPTLSLANIVAALVTCVEMRGHSAATVMCSVYPVLHGRPCVPSPLIRPTRRSL